MLNITPSSLRPSFGDALAGNVTGGAGSNPPNAFADPAGFASLLRQKQAAPSPMQMPTAPSPMPAAPSASPAKNATTEPVSPRESPDDTPATQEAEPTARGRALQKGKLRAADQATPSGRETPPAPDTETARRTGDARIDEPASDAVAPEARPATTDTPIGPGAMQWLADLQRAAAYRTDLPQPMTSAEGTAESNDAAIGESTDASTKNTRAADLKADADLADKAVQGQAQRADAGALAATGSFAAALKEQGIAEKPVVKPAEVAKDLSAIGASAQQPAASIGAEAAAPAAVAIAAPVTAPDFAHELGLSLSLLAKDGVQTAELHLNPADMGPVSVQIVMDGTQARVDFGADMAATRHAIEAGLPELASALADAGFTLAGGGVSQHAGGRGGGGYEPGSSNGDQARRIAAEDSVQRVATAARRIVTQGGIDLFA